MRDDWTRLDDALFHRHAFYDTHGWWECITRAPVEHVPPRPVRSVSVTISRRALWWCAGIAVALAVVASALG